MPVLNQTIKVTRVSNAVAVGTTAVNSSVVDMTGFEGCMFLCLWGTITDGTPLIKAQQDVVVGMGAAADLTGTSVVAAVTDDNKISILDVQRPIEGFLRCVVTRGGATGAVLDGIIAIQYGANAQPTTHDATTVAASEAWVSPIEGVA
jgi:hypothetical protein